MFTCNPVPHEQIVSKQSLPAAQDKSTVGLSVCELNACHAFHILCSVPVLSGSPWGKHSSFRQQRFLHAFLQLISMEASALEAGLGGPKPKSRKRTYMFAGLALIILIVVGVGVGVAVSRLSSVCLPLKRLILLYGILCL